MRERLATGTIGTILTAFALVLGVASAGTVWAGQNKVDICHVDGQGEYNLITNADPAYDSHLAHGDKDVETYFIDADGDGFGSTSMTVEDCSAPAGFVDNSEDCDDTDAAVNPGATEIEGNGIDDDCNPDTPDGPTATCPCEVLSSPTVWDDTITVARLTCEPDKVAVSGGFVYLTAFEGYCEMVDDNIGFSGGEMTTEAESAACRASLIQIAANDGVTCP
ncbi:putative metal-binding motif-containing protein [Candidatus Entotheonella palauensis]|uniref:putative metal-binding motif-containing protein n=1 Tax=Candidatus Entotheonella palauensis TaxID=93172 RepID=UPI002119AF9A|nr:putative metal-binding motif-containing protein [Candidatus Entotheonella palauensis]